jgi:hypothetical protein
MDKSYRYLGYVLLLLIPLTFIGFYRTYIVQFPNFEDHITIYAHLHALIASLWILMLILQPLLILKKKYSLHRAIGKLSFVVFPLLILSFIPQIIKIYNSDNIKNLFFPFADSVLLILFYSFAIYNRKTSSKHMRYMIAIAFVFLGPTVGRIGPILLGWSEIFTQNIQYGIIYSTLIGLVFYDKSNENNYKPYLTIISFFVLHQITYHLVFL